MVDINGQYRHVTIPAQNFSDATCNPYFCYAALLMAGLDGVKNKNAPYANAGAPMM